MDQKRSNMITPIDIKNKSFKGSIGYNKKEVDKFLEELYDDYETLYKNNKSLEEKVTQLNTNLTSYKTIEKQLEMSLILANKTADEVKAAASTDAENIRKQAENEANQILLEARVKLRNINLEIENLINKFEAYKANIKSFSSALIEFTDKKELDDMMRSDENNDNEGEDDV
jgi:cell division initiation protein